MRRCRRVTGDMGFDADVGSGGSAERAMPAHRRDHRTHAGRRPGRRPIESDRARSAGVGRFGLGRRASRCGLSCAVAGSGVVGDVGSGAGEFGAVGLVDGECSVGFDGERPALFVDDVVVSGAGRDHVGQVGWSAVFPGCDVVDFAAVEGDVAAVEGAGAVHGSEGSALGAVGVADAAAGVEGGAVGADDDRCGLAGADQASDRRAFSSFSSRC